VKVLVTGAAGHLGANLVRRLVDDGEDVRASIRSEADAPTLESLPVERVVGDLRDRDFVRRATSGCARIYHCAANVSTIQGDAAHKRDIYESNVIGTKNVLEAAMRVGVARVVVTGSFSAVGFDPEHPSVPSDESVTFYPFARHLPYAHTKVLVEHECWKAALRGQDVVVCTSTAILGPNDFKPSRMGRVLLDFAHRRLRAYVPGGFEFVAARDIVDGHVLAMNRGKKGEKYIISTGHTTMDEIMAMYGEATGARKPPRLPSGLVYAVVRASTGLFPRVERLMTPDAILLLRSARHADTTKARTELGFVPGDLREAVRLAYEDFARRGLVPRRERHPTIHRRDLPQPERPAGTHP
jgi:nucleoside-diphosphate-sugar epimerase